MLHHNYTPGCVSCENGSSKSPQTCGRLKRTTTYMISSGIFVFGVSVQRTHFEIMWILTNNTLSGITTNVDDSAMPTPVQPMPNSSLGMFPEDSTSFEIVPVSWATYTSPTSSIPWRSASWNIWRSRFSTSWRDTKDSTIIMQSGYPCLLTMTSHQKLSHKRKFPNGMGRR